MLKESYVGITVSAFAMALVSVLALVNWGFKLDPDRREKWLLLLEKLGRSDSQIGRSYSAKLWHFLSI